MTKQRNKIKYTFIIICGVFEIAAIIGAYVAHFYTKTRMGMLRHVIYLNGKWEKVLPIDTIKSILLIIIISLIIYAYLNYRKKNKNFKANMLAMVLNFVISGWTLYFVLAFNSVSNRAYYISSICFIVATVLQNIIYHCYLSIE